MTITDALSQSTNDKVRKELRKLTMPKFEAIGEAMLDNVFSNSPIIGTRSDQMSLRKSRSAIRDCMSIDDLMCVACDRITMLDIEKALLDPSGYGVPSSTSKTGYMFGRPKTLTQADIDGVRKAYTTIKATLWRVFDPAKHGYASISDIPLNVLIAVHDTIWSRDDDTSSDWVIDAIFEFLDKNEAKTNALRNMLELRDEIGADRIIASDPTFQIFLAVGHNLDLMAMTASASSAPKALVKPSADKEQLIDLTLKQAGLPSIGEMIDTINESTKKIADAQTKAKMSAIPMTSSVASSDGTIPSGKIKGLLKAKDVFELKGVGSSVFDFDVPVWEWDAPHPHVLPIDKDYIFRPESLLIVLTSLMENSKCWVHGHTGSGKTTLIEQVSARMHWPFMRVNFDSEISRMDLIGRDVLTNEGGTTTSKFVDGILPQMMQSPCIGCFDELDFVRPDVAYVMQRAFEGNGLLLTEDGGRLVEPNPFFRMFATANTVGQGDEFGMYQGARPQSMALLDRFTRWVDVPYMSPVQREQLLKTKFPEMPKVIMDKVNKYITEHIEAFTTAKVLQPISPRGYLALCQSIMTFTSLMTSEKKAIEQAFDATILNRSSAQDRAVLKGIINRVI
jgi:cobaltochelatase CobS